LNELSLDFNPIALSLLLTVVLFVVGGFIRPGFANYGQAINIIRLAAFLGIISAGQTLVILSGGEGIDLSVGQVVTLGAIISFRIVGGENSMIIPGLAAALASGFVIGAINGLGVTLLRIPPLVMTLGMAGVVEGLILVITRGELIGNAAPLMTRWISGSMLFGISNSVFLWFLLGGAIWVLLYRTPYGKQLFAVGSNRRTARLSGVNVPLVVIFTYALSGLLAALGGFILLSYTEQVFLNLGAPYLLPSVAAVVVGGTPLTGGKGGYIGTMAGALLLTVLNSLLTTMQMPEYARQIVYGVTLLLLLSAYGREESLRQ